MCVINACQTPGDFATVPYLRRQPAFYNVNNAQHEFPWIDKAFVPVGQYNGTQVGFADCITLHSQPMTYLPYLASTDICCPADNPTCCHPLEREYMFSAYPSGTHHKDLYDCIPALVDRTIVPVNNTDKPQPATATASKYPSICILTQHPRMMLRQLKMV